MSAFSGKRDPHGRGAGTDRLFHTNASGACERCAHDVSAAAKLRENKRAV